MSFAEKLKSRLGQMKEASSHLLADEHLVASRLLICQECPFRLPITNQCKKCGCFIAAKTKIKKAVCPVGKW